jgi:hypothetical protein
MICFRCGDDQNLVRSDETPTGAICAWCLQHGDELNEQERAALAIFDTLPESEQLRLLQSKRDREAREGEAELNAFVSQRGGWN